MALGGVAGTRQAQNKKMRWYVKCFKMAGDTKLHGFGITAYNVLRDLPWYTVDSSSWASGVRFGHIPVYNPWTHKFIKLERADIKHINEMQHIIRYYNLDPRYYVSRYDEEGYTTRGAVMALGAKSFIEFSKHLKKRHNL